MALNTGETDIYGGGGGLGGLGGGIGGFGLVGLIGLNSFLGNNGLNGTAAGVALGAGTTVLEQNVSNIRSELGALGNEFQTAINANNMANASNFRALDNRICEGEKTNLAATFQSTIQGMNNTQAIQNQASGFQVVNQENFCSVKELIHNDGDLTRSLITQNLIDGLRNELLQERRGRDNREIEINVTQSNQQTQQVLQNQMQQQGIIFANALNALGDQINRQTNQLINVGSGTVAGNPQTNSNANTKIS